MQILLLLGHPGPDSFNHAIASVCIKHLESEGHRVLFHDLYSERFDPVHHLQSSDNPTSRLMQEHCWDVKNSDAIVVIHPNWWGQPPAIVKGWMDCVLLPGVAYELRLNAKGDYSPVGLLKATKALIITTSNTPNGLENDVLGTIWNDNVFNVCGVEKVERINFGQMSISSQQEREHWLDAVQEKLHILFSNSN